MNGYIALVSILIISAIIMTIAISAGLLSISEADMGLEKNLASEAYYLASACAEEGLQQIRDSASFKGSGNLFFSNGSCNYNVIAQGPNNRTINSSGLSGDIIRKIVVTLDSINPSINIVSWTEVPDF